VKTEIKNQNNNVGVVKSCLKQSRIKTESVEDNNPASNPASVSSDVISEATLAILQTASIAGTTLKEE